MTVSVSYRSLCDDSRASFGGDEFIFVELGEAMNLAAALRIQAITAELEARDIAGIIDIAPANASYMIRLDPDTLDPRPFLHTLDDLHRQYSSASTVALQTDIVEIPVWYDDPATRDIAMKFRDRHQSATETDIEYTAKVNGLSSIDDLIDAHCSAPFIVTFPCFKPGNTECMQLVPHHRQLQAPKYLRPRTETPARAVAHGGAFTVIYPTAGVGGYQMLGRSPVPVVDLSQTLPGFADSAVLAHVSTLIRFRAIGGDEYHDLRVMSKSGRYQYVRGPVTFSLAEFLADQDGYPQRLCRALRC